MLSIPEFEVRHVNVHHPVHPANTFQTIVGRSVVNQREMQAAIDGDHERLQNLRHHVLGRDEVDVVTTDSLQIEHDSRELRRSDFGALAELARLEVLTENTAQIAPAEKDRARPVPAAQTIFFAEMRKGAGDAREPSALADPDLVFEPVDLAIARTNFARPQ